MSYLCVVVVLSLVVQVSGQGVYRALACDDRDVFLSCQPGTKIRVVDAFYGRNDSVSCLDPSRDSEMRCSAGEARETVAPLCEGRQNCVVRASDKVFGTPVGCTPRTSKTLRINYVCALSQNTALICEGSGRLSVTCPAGSILEITSAFYGRDDKTTCPHRDDTTDTVGCVANNTLNIINNTCRGLEECELFARSAIFGDPCPGTFKYLRVEFACVGCVNAHPNNAQCEQWALEGQCTTNPVWMDNNCRKSCRSCSPVAPPCQNILDDADCDFWAGQGDCTNGKFVSEMLVNCHASCTNCKKFATCQNTWMGSGNSSCAAREADGECWKNAGFMLVNCAGSCLCPANRQRDLATVQCVNHWKGEDGDATAEQADEECTSWVAEGACTTNAGFMFTNCFRACTNCTGTPYCNNIADDATCDVYLEEGECFKNPLWMFTNCYQACSGCQAQRECVNKNLGQDGVKANDAECEYWRGLGRCQDESEFMLDKCWKTCTRCEPKPIVPVCNNDFGSDEECDKYRDNMNACTNNPEWMLPYCRKSCTFCSYPFLQLAVQGPHPFYGESSYMTGGRTFIMSDAFKENGTLSHYTAFFTNTNEVSLELWRPSPKHGFLLLTSTTVKPTVSRGPMTVPVMKCFEVRIGDRIGFSSIDNRPSPIAYRFDLNAVAKPTSFRTAFSRAGFNSMKLPYVFSFAAVFDYTKTTC